MRNPFWWVFMILGGFSMNSKAELFDLHNPCADQGAVKKEIMIIR